MASDLVGSNGLQVDLRGLRQLSRDINASGDRYMKLRFRQGLMEGADIVVRAARSNASWSTRIPASIRSGATTRGVYVRAGNASAPHAVTFEGTSTGSARRHPVFARGTRANWTWSAQTPRPFLLPALNANADAVAAKVADALERAFTDFGWHQ